MITFQIIESVVNHLDLFLHNRHSPCEVVVFSDFLGQQIYFGFHDGLVFVVRDKNAQQRNAAGDD